MDDRIKLLYEDEFHVDLEDLFTIDFNKLKLVIKTTLINQDEMSKKIKELENKINNQPPFYDTHSQIEQNRTQENFKISNGNNFSIADIKKEEISEPKIIQKYENENISKIQENYDKNNEINIQNRNQDKLPTINGNKDNITNQVNIEVKINEEEINNKNNDKQEVNQKQTNENNTNDNISDDATNKTRDNVTNKTRDNVTNKTNDNVINKTNDNVTNKTNDNVTNKTNDNIKINVNDSLKNNVNDSINNTNNNPLSSPTSQINDTPTKAIKKNLNFVSSGKNINIKKKYESYENNLEDNNSKINNAVNQNKKLLDLLLSDVEGLKSRIDTIEKKAKNKERNNITPVKNTSSDNNTAEEIMLLKLQIKDVATKNSELNKENATIKKNLEEINVKLKDFNIYNIFSDKSSGDDISFDAARALVMSLEQKVFKKTGLIDEKIRRIDDTLIKVQTEARNNKNVIDVLKLSFNDFKKTLKNLGDLITKNTEDIAHLNDNTTEIQNQNNKNKESFNKKIENLNTENSKTVEKYENDLKELSDKIIETNQKINDMELRPKVKTEEVKKNVGGGGGFIRLREEVLTYINELRKSDRDLEKLIENSINKLEIDKLKDNINNIENVINQKGNSKDIIDLKNKISDQNSAITKLKDNVDKLNESTYKIRNDSNFLIKRIDTLSSGIVSNRTSIENILGKMQEFMMEATKYLDVISFNQFLENYQKDKKKNEQNIVNINKLISDIIETLKSKCGSDDMKLFEDIMNNKLKELENNCLKKFADKAEINKSIKYLDTQIRHIIDVYIKKLDKADSWLIAKKPLGGYSCASCEAYLGDINKKQQDFLPWNRYPENNKNYKVGNGFSRMLKMLNADNVYESDDEIRNSAKINNLHKNRAHSRHLSKNLSMCNIRNNATNNINNNIGSNMENGCCNLKNNILPNISANNGEEINSNLNLENEEKDIFIDGDDNKNSEDGPKVVKVYRKKLNPIDIHKKE